MADNHSNGADQPAWLNTFQREAGIRRALVMHGNARDIFYDPQERQYVSLAELLGRTLTRDPSIGFTMVGVWDQLDGLRFPTDKMLVRFQTALSGKASGGNTPSPKGESYDVGPNAPKAAPQSRAMYPDPNEVMPAIRRVLQTPSERSAFVLDFTHLLVNQAAHPDTDERRWILALAKSLAGDGPTPMNSDELKRTRGLVVFISASLGALPPVLYQGDPRVRLIAVPRPARPQRMDFFQRHDDDLRCEQPKAADGSPALAAGSVVRQQRSEALADMTDQLNLVDLRQILSLSLRTESPLTPERLLNLYRYGEQRSPWEELSEEKLRGVKEILKKRVVGQDEAVDDVATMIVRAYMGLAGLQHSGRRSKPKGTLFFVGPSGVGKTELAKACAEFLFGDESACIRFDMSEYSHEHSDQRLIGAPPGYVGFEEGGQLTNAIRQRPFSVILFDEIEKAHGRILDKFLQILEDGRLTDGRGETAYFSDSVIIFTSNIGAAQLPESNDPQVMRLHFQKAVEDHFVQKLNRPELLNRIGENVVVFNKITDASFQKSILRRKLQPLHAYLRERFGIGMQTCEALESHYLQMTRAEHGGRGILNVLERHLINPLAWFLFERRHQLRQGRKVTATLEGEKTALELAEE